MNEQGKAVGPYMVYGQNALGVWRLKPHGPFNRLRGDGGAVLAAKEMLNDGCRVVMIVDADEHVTHMEYWGLAQPRTMKLAAGSYDFFEAMEVYRLLKIRQYQERQRVALREYEQGVR